MNRLIALAASVLINAAVLGGLNWNVQREATPVGTVQVTDLNDAGSSKILLAAAGDAH
jgi:hypothetical protein